MQEGFSGLSPVFDPLTTEEGLLLSGSTLFLGVWLVKGDESPESELDGEPLSAGMTLALSAAPMSPSAKATLPPLLEPGAWTLAAMFWPRICYTTTFQESYKTLSLLTP